MTFDITELLKSFEHIGSLYAVVKDLYGGKFFPLPSVVVAAVDAGWLRNVDGGVTPSTKSIYTMSFFLTDDGRRKCGLAVFMPPPPEPVAPPKTKKTERKPPPSFAFD